MTQAIGQTERGGFAELLAVPADLLHPIPDGIDLATASLTEPIAVALHGLRLAGARAEPAVVFGLGPIGLLTVAALHDLGAPSIVGVDPIEQRRALALTLGADHATAPGDPSITAARADLVVEASGHPDAVAEAGNVAASGGRVLLLGIPMTEVTLWPMVWVTKELTILGSISHETRDFTDALALLARAPQLGEVITERLGLDDVPAAFERLIAAPDAGKVLAVP